MWKLVREIIGFLGVDAALAVLAFAKVCKR